MPLRQHKRAFEELYERYNRRQFVHPDPLEFLYEYDDPADRELVGLVASSLAYGRVAQILRSVRTALDRLGPRPARFLRDTTPRQIDAACEGFRHRFQTQRELSALLRAMKAAAKRHGSLQACFESQLSRGEPTVLDALGGFVRELLALGGEDCASLLSDPARGSACKRLHLYLRWMVRRDDVDPGGWDGVPPALLVVPLDTHMHKIAVGLGATRRKAADMRAAVELTEAFRRVCPDDPVRYDFSLTRLGIRPEGGLGAFLDRCNSRKRAARAG